MCISSRNQRGISLIELLVFIVIIGIALVAILQVQIQAARISADPQLRKQALAIAESLLEEVTLAKFTFCDPTDVLADSAPNPAGCNSAALQENVDQEGGGVRRPFDNVNDYVTAFGTPTAYATDSAGNAFPAGYTASVTITPDAGLGPAGLIITPADATATNMNVLRVTVTVTYRNGAEMVILDGYRTRYAPNALP
jgi:MSHA pilin protein MshD